MQNTSEKYINHLFTEYKDHLDNGSNQAAFIKLAEINNLLTWGDFKKGTVLQWYSVIKMELEKIDLQQVVLSLRHDIDRIQSIISVGSSFLYEEFVLILTLRYQIELAKELFNQFKSIDDEVLDCVSIDDELVELTEMTVNKKQYDQARRQIKKNWNLLGPVLNVPYKQYSLN